MSTTGQPMTTLGVPVTVADDVRRRQAEALLAEGRKPTVWELIARAFAALDELAARTAGGSSTSTRRGSSTSTSAAAGAVDDKRGQLDDDEARPTSTSTRTTGTNREASQ